MREAFCWLGGGLATQRVFSNQVRTTIKKKCLLWIAVSVSGESELIETWTVSGENTTFSAVTNRLVYQRSVEDDYVTGSFLRWFAVFRICGQACAEFRNRARGRELRISREWLRKISTFFLGGRGRRFAKLARQTETIYSLATAEKATAPLQSEAWPILLPLPFRGASGTADCATATSPRSTHTNCILEKRDGKSFTPLVQDSAEGWTEPNIFRCDCESEQKEIN